MGLWGRRRAAGRRVAGRRRLDGREAARHGRWTQARRAWATEARRRKRAATGCRLGGAATGERGRAVGVERRAARGVGLGRDAVTQSVGVPCVSSTRVNQ